MQFQPQIGVQRTELGLLHLSSPLEPLTADLRPENLFFPLYIGLQSKVVGTTSGELLQNKKQKISMSTCDMAKQLNVFGLILESLEMSHALCLAISQPFVLHVQAVDASPVTPHPSPSRLSGPEASHWQELVR